MSIIKAIPMLAQLANRLVSAYERWQLRKQEQAHKDKISEIKENPEGAHSQRFGPSSGSVSVSIDKTSMQRKSSGS